MKVRGAPAIAISALLGLAAEAYGPLKSIKSGLFPPGFVNVDEAIVTLKTKLDHLFTSRPTAVNLGNAITECQVHLEKMHATLDPSKVADFLESFIQFAEEYHQRDIAMNRAMGEYGAAHILKHCTKDSSKVRILTHCNTGALATSQYGTALGVAHFIHKRNALERIYCTETRPYNQGARLTAYECVQEGMPTTLIVDSSVSYLMQQTVIDAVVLGADRICNNGDVANKIGTYQIALSAKYHTVPFFVAAPSTTLDLTLADGSGIQVEQRPTEEITHNAQTGERVVVKSDNLSVWNPSFDVTPASLISGIITEQGVILPNKEGKYDVRAWLAEQPSAA